ncbi:glycerophosphodiester phosphodiesterase family protein [Pseudarthrobacter sp. NPDC055928]|uniref:glycerophosphodiester phosphodiesterase family protein n=1 Tax=Pseudarthrobacter sp. NPDC055928 TaxID=3345661 RepID=UPI0035DAAFD6
MKAWPGTESGPKIGRRGFLGLVAAAGVLNGTGCGETCPQSPVGQAARPVPNHVSASEATASLIEEGALAAAGDVGPFTMAGLLAAPSFFVAHRGSGDNWPEHTMLAYTKAAAAGLKALEVSVVSTGDGVLVCHHDLNTERLTGTDLIIARASYAALESLRNDARAWLGPAAPLEPIPLLEDVLRTFLPSRVIFLEDKQGTNADELLELLEAYPGARDRVVWKQPASSPGHALARSRGYTTWGYVTAPDYDNLAALIPRVDLLGVHNWAPSAVVRELVASGKPVAAWEVRRRSDYARLKALGVRGFVCSNVVHVLHLEERRAEDGFDTGLRYAGDLPQEAEGDWQGQPALQQAAVRISSEEPASYLMGSMGGLSGPQRELAFELRWPEGLPAGTGSAGVAFGQDDDAPYRPDAAVSGYELEFGADGRLTLSRRDKGAGPVVLAEAKGAPPGAGEWTRLVLTVTPQRVIARRPDQQGADAETDDTAYGGGWFSLLKNYDAGPAVEFRNVTFREATAADACEPR